MNGAFGPRFAFRTHPSNLPRPAARRAAPDRPVTPQACLWLDAGASPPPGGRALPSRICMSVAGFHSLAHQPAPYAPPNAPSAAAILSRNAVALSKLYGICSGSKTSSAASTCPSAARRCGPGSAVAVVLRDRPLRNRHVLQRHRPVHRMRLAGVHGQGVAIGGDRLPQQRRALRPAGAAALLCERVPRLFCVIAQSTGCASRVYTVSASR